MDAIVLVGGQGTRLRPLTATRHKSLVPVCNRPAIEYLFDWLRRSGIARAVLALGQDNEDLALAYPPGRYEGLDIALVIEQQRLESGGAIRNAVAASGIEGRFLVLNGDIFVDFDFGAALRAHKEHQAELTLALHEVDDPSMFGVAVVDAEGMVTGFVEKPPAGEAPSNLVNAGVWIFEPRLVDEIPLGPVRVEETLFPSLVARRRRVLGYRFGGTWADIGSPARYLALNTLLLREGERRKAKSKRATSPETPHAPCLSPFASVAPEATIQLSSIGPGCNVAAGARITGSILWEDVIVGVDAEIRDSIIADGVNIGRGACVVGAVVGSRATIGPQARVPTGTSIEPGARYDAQDDH